MPSAALNSNSSTQSFANADSSRLHVNRFAHQKQLLIAGLLVFSTLVACELVARFVVYVGKPATVENAQYQMKFLVAKKISSKDDNVLLCGSSLMKCGLYPSMISAKLKEINPKIRVVNLAVNGGTQADGLAYLNYLERRGVIPRLVVFDYELTNLGTNHTLTAAVSSRSNSPQSLSQQIQPSRGYLFEGLLQRPQGILKNFSVGMADLSYIVRHRGNLKRFILEFLKAIQFPQRFERKAFWELTDSCDMGTTDDGMCPNNKMLLIEDRSAQKNAIWPFHSTSPQAPGYVYNTNFYSPIIDYCQQHKIPLVLLWLPHLSSIYREYYCQAPYTEDWFKRQFENYSRQPYVHPIYLNSLDENYNYYADYRHLSTYGCVKASELFAATLSKLPYSELIKPRAVSTNDMPRVAN